MPVRKDRGDGTRANAGCRPSSASNPAAATGSPADTPRPGPGTALYKLEPLLIMDVTTCRDRMQIVAMMDRWGPDKCQAKIATLLQYIERICRARQIEYDASDARAVLEHAIETSRG